MRRETCRSSLGFLMAAAGTIAAVNGVTAAGLAPAKERHPAGAAMEAATCTASDGPLALRALATRTHGISPLLVFFDATATTDTSVTGNTTAFQDVTYTWNFGDGGASGTDTWAYGANKGNNTRNGATGAIAAHLFQSSADTSYVVTITARNGTNNASCQLGVKAYNPAGANGFAGSKTTCVSSSSTPVPGGAGCPAGAAVLRTSSFSSAIGSALGSNKRLLFKCGDTFSGDNATVSGVEWSVGAYGGCENTTSGRPVMRDSGTTGQFTIAHGAGDGRIADLDFEGNGNAGYAVQMPGGGAVTYQITLFNLNSNGNVASYMWAGGSQWAVIDSVQTGMKNIGTFGNFGENNPPYSGANNIDYTALLGNSFNGAGAPNDGSGIETVRISACRMCVISNNTFQNANNVGAVLKVHSGNTYLSQSAWVGLYSELIEISDNWFGGTSGANLVETAPQNGSDDERLRNIVVERNLFSGGAPLGRQLLAASVNETIRNNVFYGPAGVAKPPAYGIQIARRGVEPTPSAVEVYNNTCYFLSGTGGQTCVGFDGTWFAAAGGDSAAKNNLFYTPSPGRLTVTDKGHGNIVGSNSPSPGSDPAMRNAGGRFDLISDFKPSASYAGGTGVPVWTDALGAPWTSRSLGALRP